MEGSIVGSQKLSGGKRLNRGHLPVPDDGKRHPNHDRNDQQNAAVKSVLPEQQGLVRDSRRFYACL